MKIEIELRTWSLAGLVALQVTVCVALHASSLSMNTL